MAVRNKPLGRIDVNVIDDIWKGSIDMHIHPGRIRLQKGRSTAYRRRKWRSAPKWEELY